VPKRRLTKAEERAYSELARAAKKLRKAQADAERRARRSRAANARLIAAAPDLLAACETFDQIKTAADTGTVLVANQGQALDGFAERAAYRAAVDDARAAIAAARGE